jgi:hypothetical protein
MATEDPMINPVLSPGADPRGERDYGALLFGGPYHHNSEDSGVCDALPLPASSAIAVHNPKSMNVT